MAADAPVVADEAMAVAEALAAKDRELLANLKDLRAAVQVAEQGKDEDRPVEPTRMPMNRHQRRQRVAQYAAVLAASERQAPVVNPTIIPRSKRRRRAK